MGARATLIALYDNTVNPVVNTLSTSDLTVAAAAGSDVLGLIAEVNLKCQEAIQILTYLKNDVLTDAQDSTAYTAITTAITDLS